VVRCKPTLLGFWPVLGACRTPFGEGARAYGIWRKPEKNVRPPNAGGSSFFVDEKTLFLIFKRFLYFLSLSSVIITMPHHHNALCDSAINTDRNYSCFCIVALKIAIMEGCQVIGPEKQAESERG